jgi:nitronate monooxygenase
MGITEDLLKREKKVDFGEELTVHKDDAKAWATIWSAGQGVTNIHDAPSVADLVSELKKDFRSAIEEQLKYLEIYK